MPGLSPPRLAPGDSLTSELEWLLQSGEAPPETIASALLQAHYPAVERFARAYAPTPDLAHHLAIHTFTQALLNLHTYRLETGIQTWLFRFLLAGCRRLDRPHPEETPAPTGWPGALHRLDPDHRALVLLVDLLGWSTDEAAPTLGWEPAQAAARLESARQKLLTGMPPELAATDPLPALLQAQWPAQTFPPDEVEDLTRQVLVQAGRQDRRRKAYTRLREILLTFAGIFIVGLLLWRLDLLAPLPEPPRPTPRVVTRVVLQEITRTPGPTRSPSSATGLPPRITPTPGDVFYIVREGENLPEIAVRLGVTQRLLREANRLPERYLVTPGQALVIPGSLPTPTPWPHDPPPTRTAPPPLEYIPSTDELLDQLSASRSQAMPVWLDGVILDYGPAGYTGPVQMTRIQAWLAQEHTLALHGPLDGDPQEVLLRQQDLFHLAWPGSGDPWFTALGLYDPRLKAYVDRLGLLMPYFGPERPSGFTLTGEESLLGRRTFIVEQRDQGRLQARYWLDNPTGWVIRARYYSPEDELLLKEVLLTRFEPLVELPQTLLDPQLPWRGGFASGPSGEPAPGDEILYVPEVSPRPEKHGLRLAPYGYDASQDAIAFHYPGGPDAGDGEAGDRLHWVNVITDELFLFRARVPPAWDLNCARSSDGRRIALASRSALPLQPGAGIRWFDLADLGESHTRLEDMQVVEFAFSPDGGRLAVYGKRERFPSGAIYIIDLESEDPRPDFLREARDLSSMMWSPDGRFLASVQSGSLVVANVQSGRVIYSASLSARSLDPPPGAPIYEWDQPFPARMAGLEACTHP